MLFFIKTTCWTSFKISCYLSKSGLLSIHYRFGQDGILGLNMLLILSFVYKIPSMFDHYLIFLGLEQLLLQYEFG